MASRPGYTIGRDESGLTTRESQVLDGLQVGRTPLQISVAIGVTKQRVSNIITMLVKKGRVSRTEAGGYEVKS